MQEGQGGGEAQPLTGAIRLTDCKILEGRWLPPPLQRVLAKLRVDRPLLNVPY